MEILHLGSDRPLCKRDFNPTFNFANQFIVSVIDLSKLMIPMTLFEKFSSLSFITSIKVFFMTAHSCKSSKLRNIHSIRGTAWYIAIRKKENLQFQNQSHRLYHKFERKQNH